MTPRDETEITGLKKEDVAAIAEIERLCFTDPWSEKSIEEDISNPLAFYVVLKKEGRVAGYIGSRVIGDTCEITTVAVSPSFRGRGFAQRLFSALFLKLDGVKYVNLEVRESNVPARALYEKLGFKECGRRKGYYDAPREDAVLYTRYSEEK